MNISKAIIKNYKLLLDTSVEFNAGKNIIVGPNEAGKSTLLEAINLALTGQIDGRSILYDIHPFLFNLEHVNEYLIALRQGGNPNPPYFEIELYFNNNDEIAEMLGINNTLRVNCPGISIRCDLADRFRAEYETLISTPEKVTTVPVEFYEITWKTFANRNLSPRSKPLKTSMVDTGNLNQKAGPNNFVISELTGFLSAAERASLSLSYRSMKDAFVADEGITSINDRLAGKTGEISDKSLSIALDVSSRGSWESGIITKLDEVPFSQVGKGEQSSVKVQLALDASSDCQIFLVEEPENHLSFTNLHRLVSRIVERSAEKQLFITTHSNFVLNKLDIGNVLLFRSNHSITLDSLTTSTRDYFLKLPGHDTLRMILATGKVILVEGPSDELVIQKAYRQKHGKLPQEDGVDIITVRSLAFKRFLEISVALKIETHVVTDNDGDIASITKKYEDFAMQDFIQIHHDLDESYPTLEPQLLKVNSLSDMNTILGKAYATKEELLQYMQNNKTDAALQIFNSNQEIIIPEYIQNTI